MESNRSHDEGSANISFVHDISGGYEAHDIVDGAFGVIAVDTVEGHVGLDYEVNCLQREKANC